MELTHIKDLAQKNKIAIRHIANAISMTESNLHKCIRDNRIEAGDLERLSAFLGVPILYFFIEDIDNMNIEMDINEGKKRSSSTLSVVNKVLTPQEAQKEIEHLQEVITLKDELIELLRSTKK